MLTLHLTGMVSSSQRKAAMQLSRQQDWLEQQSPQDFPGTKAKLLPALQTPCQRLVAPFLSSNCTDLHAPIFTWPPAPQQWWESSV